MPHIRRRTFITLLGGATIWPFAARAQQTATIPVSVFPAARNNRATE
jgi:hypothetical protein